MQRQRHSALIGNTSGDGTCTFRNLHRPQPAQPSLLLATTASTPARPSATTAAPRQPQQHRRLPRPVRQRRRRRATSASTLVRRSAPTMVTSTTTAPAAATRPTLVRWFVQAETVEWSNGVKRSIWSTQLNVYCNLYSSCGKVAAADCLGGGDPDNPSETPPRQTVLLRELSYQVAPGNRGSIKAVLVRGNYPIRCRAPTVSRTCTVL